MTLPDASWANRSKADWIASPSRMRSSGASGTLPTALAVCASQLRTTGLRGGVTLIIPQFLSPGFVAAHCGTGTAVQSAAIWALPAGGRRVQEKCWRGDLLAL